MIVKRYWRKYRHKYTESSDRMGVLPFWFYSVVYGMAPLEVK